MGFPDYPEGPTGPTGATGNDGQRGSLFSSGDGDPTTTGGELTGDSYLDLLSDNFWEFY